MADATAKFVGDGLYIIANMLQKSSSSMCSILKVSINTMKGSDNEVEVCIISKVLKNVI